MAFENEITMQPLGASICKVFENCIIMQQVSTCKYMQEDASTCQAFENSVIIQPVGSLIRMAFENRITMQPVYVSIFVFHFQLEIWP